MLPLMRAAMVFAGLLLAAAAARSAETAQTPTLPMAWSASTPALRLRDPQDQWHDLAEFRGKVVLLHFWESDCDACREELPALSALVARYADAGLAVLLVNVGESRIAIRQFLARLPVAGLVLEDHDAGTPETWKTTLVPATYLIDRGGRIAFRQLGPLDWSASAVRTWLERQLAAPGEKSGGR